MTDIDGDKDGKEEDTNEEEEPLEEETKYLYHGFTNIPNMIAREIIGITIPSINNAMWMTYVMGKENIEDLFTTVKWEREESTYITKTLETWIILFSILEEYKDPQDVPFIRAIQECIAKSAPNMFKIKRVYGDLILQIVRKNSKRTKVGSLQVNIRAFNYLERLNQYGKKSIESDDPNIPTIQLEYTICYRRVDPIEALEEYEKMFLQNVDSAMVKQHQKEREEFEKRRTEIKTNEMDPEVIVDDSIGDEK